jgi:hypothetical protein
MPASAQRLCQIGRERIDFDQTRANQGFAVS